MFQSSTKRKSKDRKEKHFRSASKPENWAPGAAKATKSSKRNDGSEMYTYNKSDSEKRVQKQNDVLKNRSLHHAILHHRGRLLAVHIHGGLHHTIALHNLLLLASLAPLHQSENQSAHH